MISFTQFQDSLLKKEMAVAVECSDPSDEIITNKIVTGPLCDLHTTVRETALEVLSVRFQERNRFFQMQKPDDQYLEILVNEFEEEQAEWRNSAYRRLEWLDDEDPRKGIIFKSRKDISYYFDLVLMPARTMAFWDAVLTTDIDEKTNKNVRKSIQWCLEEAEEDGVQDLFSQNFFSFFIISEFSSKKKYQQFKFTYLTNVLSPILDQYKQYHLYVASNDTTYPSIERSDFYPIIAGERLDGSHEVTIFWGINT